MRLMAVSLTEQQVEAGTKDVTRRMGWDVAEPGMPLALCRKVMGRKRRDGTVEPLVRLRTVVVTEAYKEPLGAITQDEVIREGFPDMTPDEFVAFFCATHRKAAPDRPVTRIAWRYTDGGPVNVHVPPLGAYRLGSSTPTPTTTQGDNGMADKEKPGLGRFGNREVIGTAVAITNAGDGLSKALGVDPQLLDLDEKVYIVLECDVNKVSFTPVKDAHNKLTRVHNLKTVGATIVDEDLVRAHLDEQAKRIEEHAGVHRLPLDENPGASE